MSYVVTENCVKCKYTDCVEACPVEAFHEGDDMLVINPDECIDCNNCVDACPVDAIFEESEVPDNMAQYIEMNEKMASLWPVITEKKDPLPTALTLEEIQARSPTQESTTP